MAAGTVGKIDELMITQELGDNANLLLCPDLWLDNQQQILQQQMSLLVEELEAIMTAKRLKIALQQQNLVAVQLCTGTGVCLKVLSLPQALVAIEQCCQDAAVPPDIAARNAELQRQLWRQDGYELPPT